MELARDVCIAAPQADSLAHPSLSVAGCRAVGLGASGALYVGVNLEFPQSPLNNSVHAEQFLVVNALQYGETEIKLMAISEAPCGHCRQFFTELACADTVSVCVCLPCSFSAVFAVLESIDCAFDQEMSSSNGSTARTDDR